MQHKLIFLAFLLLAVFAQDQPVDAHVTAVTQDKQAPVPQKYQRASELTEKVPATKQATSRVPIAITITTFTIHMHTYCPNQVWLWIYTSGPFTYSVNSTNVTLGWYPANTWLKLPIKPNCQCTTITIRVFNFKGGIAKIAYGLYQNTINCFKCDIPDKFWNYQTCRCQCKLNCCIKGRGWSVDQKRCQCAQGVVTQPIALTP